MPFQSTNPINMVTVRSYDVYVPPTPRRALLPAIIVFHGGGQDIHEIEERWGINPAIPVPALVANYLLIFAETDPTLNDEWVHYSRDDSRFPEHDLLFVDTLVNEITTTAYNTGDPNIPTVSADPNLLYAAGFSSGGGMSWQIANSSRVALFKGFAAVGKALDPEKATHFRQQQVPPPIPFIYIMGTSDPLFRSPVSLLEVPIDSTYPFYSVKEMLSRNGIPNSPAQTQLIAGSTNVTEVATQVWPGGGGMTAFSYVTVINGGHNWPTPTTVGNPPVAAHFNATEAIVQFWAAYAGLPI